VIEALAALRPDQIGFYPPYEATTRACASYIGVDPDRLSLVNGLDEGILAAAIAYLQRDPGDAPFATGAAGDGGKPEGLIAEPCFGMYADCIEAVGGRIVRVPPPASLDTPLDALLAAITPRTRVIYLTSPGNPSGLLVPAPTVHALARALPQGLVFVDEAYADFTDAHFLGELERAPNVVVGRTFAKAYGLAALRIGAVVGSADVIARLRRSLPPYSINVAAAVALEAALGDQVHLEAYRAQVRASKAQVYAFCDRLGLGYWRSDANFVLVRVGPRATAVVEALRERRIFVRDRSTEPGCAGCIRITAGVLAHTEQALAALEEILCAVA
jgi:histidinol-phosphate aminotransferase